MWYCGTILYRGIILYRGDNVQNEKTWKVQLGEFLKSKRQKNKISAQSVADQMELSQSQISAIENGQKKTPTLKFIKDYLAIISKDIEEYNLIVEEINNFSNGRIHLAKLDVNGDTQKEVNSFKFSNSENEEKNLYFDLPINDLIFHLKDYNNNKFFGSYRLNDDERNHLINYIYMFLKHSKESKISLLTKQENTLNNKLKEIILRNPNNYSNSNEYKDIHYFLTDVVGDLQMNKIQLYEIEKIFSQTINSGE